jgi:hypothetical protein
MISDYLGPETPGDDGLVWPSQVLAIKLWESWLIKEVVLFISTIQV